MRLNERREAEVMKELERCDEPIALSDESAGQDIGIVVRSEIVALTNLWTHEIRPHKVPDALVPLVSEWLHGLSPGKVEAYCSAAAVLMRKLLLDASTSDVDAVGRIESVAGAPYFE